MTHIALIPVGRKFLTEHLTLVWMGNTNLDQERRGKTLVDLINAYLGDSKNDETVESPCFQVHDADRAYRNFNGIMVATGTVSAPLQHFRKSAVMLGLNASGYQWTPHISGENGSWRNPLEVVNFTYAELVTPSRTGKVDK